jgi:hypothetical protein
VIEIDRRALGLGPLGQKLVGGRVVETELPLDNACSWSRLRSDILPSIVAV